MAKFSIIIPVKDNLDITRVCIDSFNLYSDDFEMIIIDDGSNQETKIYLESLKDIKLIRNEISQGWCHAINQGISQSSGEYLVFSNNDVVVTPSWQKKALSHFLIDKNLGILGPVTNKVTGYQSIDYNKEGIDFQYADVLTFFFVIVKREIIEKVGLLDERFGLGGQDDADYSIRVRKAGYKIGIARDIFIYHYGSATFRNEFKNDVEKSKNFANSRINILRDKYRDKFDTGVRKRIFVAIPNGGSLVAPLVINLIQWTHDLRYLIHLYTPEGIFPLDAARNRCIKEFLETDCDYIWWIDDDIVPPLNTLEKLLQADKDAIGAVCFAMKYEGDVAFPYPVTLRYNEEKKYIVYYGKGIEEVDATGGACVLVKRKIYESIERPYEFVYHKDGTLVLTCDFRIWQKAQELGYKIYIDFSILCSHYKKVDLKKFQDLLIGIKNGK